MDSSGGIRRRWGRGKKSDKMKEKQQIIAPEQSSPGIPTNLNYETDSDGAAVTGGLGPGSDISGESDMMLGESDMMIGGGGGDAASGGGGGGIEIPQELRGGFELPKELRGGAEEEEEEAVPIRNVGVEDICNVSLIDGESLTGIDGVDRLPATTITTAGHPSGGDVLNLDNIQDIDALNAKLPGLPADFSMNIGARQVHRPGSQRNNFADIEQSTDDNHHYGSSDDNDNHYGGISPTSLNKLTSEYQTYQAHHEPTRQQRIQEEERERILMQEIEEKIRLQQEEEKQQNPKSPYRLTPLLKTPRIFKGRKKQQQEKQQPREGSVHSDLDDDSEPGEMDFKPQHSPDAHPKKSVSKLVGSQLKKGLRPFGRLVGKRVHFGGGGGSKKEKGTTSDGNHLDNEYNDDYGNDHDRPPIRSLAVARTASFGSDGGNNYNNDTLRDSAYSDHYGSYGASGRRPRQGSDDDSYQQTTTSRTVQFNFDNNANAGESDNGGYGGYSAGADSYGGYGSGPVAILSSQENDSMLALLDPSKFGGLADITTGGGFAPSSAPRGERARYSVYQGTGARATKKKFRVRPYHCFTEPTSMTEEEIYNDSLLPSKKFERLKSYLASSNPKLMNKKTIPDSVKKLYGSPEEDGRIGSFRIEILGAISLTRTKPDICCYIVVGDTAFCTDIVNGYRSPMWPSPSRRAAIFPVHHAYARVFIGVFDVKARANKDTDAFCGRVAIDIPTLRPNTEYDITFPLRISTYVYDRRPRGVLRARFSLHWFSERDAIMSYFKIPRSLAKRTPLVEGHPLIPCADPRTFRNVAMTVHGQDFPGKYSRNAFRATMREFNLYRINLIQLAKISIKDAILYETPYISFYLFAAGMYSVYLSSIHLIPAMFMGYILILYIENYKHYVTQTSFNFGYKPLTIWEIACGLLCYNPDSQIDLNLQPIVVQKRTKRRKHQKQNIGVKLKQLGDGNDPNTREIEIEQLDHREFPFGEREAYPKLAVEDALAPSKVKGGRRGSTTALHGRLSVYYTATPPTQADAVENEEEEESSDDDDRDDETVMTESQMEGDNMFNLDMEDDDDEVMANESEKKAQADATDAIAKSRLKAGPPQSNDVTGGQKIPPQVHLKKTEFRMHKLTRGLSVELVHPPPELEREWAAELACSSATDKMEIMKKKRLVMDDFDRLLGLQTKSANPVARIASSFLGPLMRMIRIGVYIIRIGFNASTWRDPYLSFWVLILLMCICFILAVFPWRKFFFLVCLALFGPQNLAIRQYLEKKKAKKLAKEKEEAEAAARGDTYGYGDATPDLAGKVSDYGYEVAGPDKSDLNTSQHGKEKDLTSSSMLSNPLSSMTSMMTTMPTLPSMPNMPNMPKIDMLSSLTSSVENKMNFFQRKLAMGRPKKDGMGSERESELADGETDRPAFKSEVFGQFSKKGMSRSVAVPYSRFRKERFYDWPPDPTVSRATPIPAIVGDASLWYGDDDSLTAGPPVLNSVSSFDGNDNIPINSVSGGRRRRGRGSNDSSYGTAQDGYSQGLDNVVSFDGLDNIGSSANPSGGSRRRSNESSCDRSTDCGFDKSAASGGRRRRSNDSSLGRNG